MIRRAHQSGPPAVERFAWKSQESLLPQVKWPLAFLQPARTQKYGVQAPSSLMCQEAFVNGNFDVDRVISLDRRLPSRRPVLVALALGHLLSPGTPDIKSVLPSLFL